MVFRIEEVRQSAVRDSEGKIITIISNWSENSSFVSFFTGAYEGHHSSMLNSEIDERVQSGEWTLLREGEA